MRSDSPYTRNDSFSDFIDHFILVLAARFRAPLYTWDGVTLGGKEASLAWNYVSRNVQLLLSTRACLTPAERQEVQHVDPLYFTPSVCRERVMYLQWKLKEERKAKKLLEASVNASQPAPTLSTSTAAGQAPPAPSTFDITKDSLTDTVTNIYDSVRQLLPSSLLDPSEDDEEEEEQNTHAREDHLGNEAPLPSSLSSSSTLPKPAPHVGGTGTDRDRKEEEEDVVPNDVDAIRRGAKQFFRPPTFQPPSPPCAEARGDAKPLSTDGAVQEDEKKSVEPEKNTRKPKDEGLTSFQLEASHIVRVPMRSDAQVQREKEVALARDAMLTKMQDMQTAFFQQFRRWVDLPEDLLEDPPLPPATAGATAAAPTSTHTVAKSTAATLRVSSSSRTTTQPDTPLSRQPTSPPVTSPFPTTLLPSSSFQPSPSPFAMTMPTTSRSVPSIVKETAEDQARDLLEALQGRLQRSQKERGKEDGKEVKEEAYLASGTPGPLPTASLPTLSGVRPQKGKMSEGRTVTPPKREEELPLGHQSSETNAREALPSSPHAISSFPTLRYKVMKETAPPVREGGGRPRRVMPLEYEDDEDE